jgi:hypothetical protein
MRTCNQSELARIFGVSRCTVTAWKKRDKMRDLFLDDGRINLDLALKKLPGRIAPSQQQRAYRRWRNKKPRHCVVSRDDDVLDKGYVEYLELNKVNFDELVKEIFK